MEGQMTCLPSVEFLLFFNADAVFAGQVAVEFVVEFGKSAAQFLLVLGGDLTAVQGLLGAELVETFLDGQGVLFDALHLRRPEAERPS